MEKTNTDNDFSSDGESDISELGFFSSSSSSSSYWSFRSLSSQPSIKDLSSDDNLSCGSDIFEKNDRTETLLSYSVSANPLEVQHKDANLVISASTLEFPLNEKPAKKHGSRKTSLKTNKQLSKVRKFEETKSGKLSKSASENDHNDSDTEQEDDTSCPNADATSLKCSSCLKSFASESEKDCHICTESTYCDICGEIFETQEAVDAHRITHLACELYRCKICKHESTNKEEYLTHYRTHLGQTSFTCHICDKDLKSFEALESHIQNHKGNKALCCDMCGKYFRFYSSFKRHFESHQKSHICNLCGEVFADKLLCHQHKLKHAERKIHRCEICQKEFHRPYQLAGHLQIHDEAKKFECKECETTYAYRTSLLRHNLKYHSPNAQMHHCTQCGESFKNRRMLNSHIVLHTAKKLIKCDECDRTFKYYSSLKRHKQAHKGLKPFVCPHCEKSFRCNSHLKTHMLIHLSSESFTCTHCGEIFKFQCFLKKHMATDHPGV